MKDAKKFDVVEIIEHFSLVGHFEGAIQYGNGYINDTFLLITRDGDERYKYILQRINHNLFKDVAKLMNNIELVTKFCKKSVIKLGGNPNKEVMSIIHTKEGKNFYFDGYNYFRMITFIDNSFSYDIVSDEKVFYNSAVAFGKFARLLDGFDASKLYDVLPNFHDTRVRLETFKKSLEKDVCNRKAEVEKEINFVLDHADLAPLLYDKLEKGEIPLRVTHNDTKCNNVLFDKDTKEALAVIDLDTVMSGCLAFDFGDAIRSGCNSSTEDEKDLQKVYFRFDLYKAYAKGYLEVLGDLINEEEKLSLPLGAIIMTYECGVRFLTDYLDGDVYFKTSKPKQNLYRARTQFKLVKDMLELYEEMKEVILNN